MIAKISINNEIKEAQASKVGKFFIYITFLLLFPILFFIATRNTFIRKQQKIEETASDIEVQLKKRFDLLTKLIDAVKESMKFEKTLQKNIVALRNSVKPNQTINSEDFNKTNSLMDEITRQLNITLENYPEIKSVEAVIEFQKQAGNVEDNISAARRFYNTAVRDFNQSCQTYPTNVAASSLHLKTRPYFEATEAEKQDIKVSFN